MIKSKRSCWWCSHPLMMDRATKVISHKVVKTPDGNEVWVHATCEQAAAQEQKVRYIFPTRKEES